MFCFNCGHQIPDDALYCSKCGTAQNVNVTSISTSSHTESKDLDREAIKIYLSNILALECMKAKLTEERNETEANFIYEKNNNYIERVSIPYGYVWLAYHDGKYHVGAFREHGDGAYTGEYLNRDGMLDGEGFIKYVWGQGVVVHNGEFYWGIIDDQSFPIIKKTSFWWDVGGGNILEQKLRQASARDGFLKAYEKFQYTAPQIYQKNLVEKINPLNQQLSEVECELDKANELLQKAYDINIIPKKFRTIHAVWFIHDFVTTSNETLSTALLQCKLDDIEQKLDKIIEQNNRIIIQNAINNSQNTQILQQNQQMLTHLASIENNTEKAAQYAEIASNNAEACAWISAANYIKK